MLIGGLGTRVAVLMPKVDRSVLLKTELINTEGQNENGALSTLWCSEKDLAQRSGCFLSSVSWRLSFRETLIDGV